MRHHALPALFGLLLLSACATPAPASKTAAAPIGRIATVASPSRLNRQVAGAIPEPRPSASYGTMMQANVMPSQPAGVMIGGSTVLLLRHGSATQLAAMFRPYVRKNVSIIADPGRNALVIAGDSTTRGELATLAQLLDFDAQAGRSYAMFPVAPGDAKGFAAAFTAALAERGDTSGPGAATVTPLEQLGGVLIMARSPTVLGDASRLYAVLNQVQNESARSWRVFNLRNCKADDATYVLQQAFTPDDVTALPAATTSAGPGASGSGAKIQIIPDLQHNALLVDATPREDGEIEAMLAKIDIAPLQVRIDATIAEVDLTGALQYGTQFFFKSGDINVVLSNGASSNLATHFPGFVLSGNGGDAAPLAISALQAVTKVRVLAAPELTVLDGQTASLQGGSMVPYLTQTSQNTTGLGAPAINSVAYRPTGVILSVTPHIGMDGMVTLDVEQQVSGVAPGITTPGLDSPTFTERSVASRVAVQGGQTIGLAGLIYDRDSHQNQGLPYLKNIPVLGALFGSQNNHRMREEMLVLITPHVIGNQQQALELTADLEEQLPNAARAPGLLQATPLAGSADPDAAIRAGLGQ